MYLRLLYVLFLMEKTFITVQYTLCFNKHLCVKNKYSLTLRYIVDTKYKVLQNLTFNHKFQKYILIMKGLMQNKKFVQCQYNISISVQFFHSKLKNIEFEMNNFSFVLWYFSINDKFTNFGFYTKYWWQLGAKLSNLCKSGVVQLFFCTQLQLYGRSIDSSCIYFMDNILYNIFCNEKTKKYIFTRYNKHIPLNCPFNNYQFCTQRFLF